MMVMTIAVLMTCHNRVKKTLQCLDSLFAQKMQSSVNINVFLVDDGSTDDTAKAVRERFPHVKVLSGDGSLYWNRGMHLAFGEALKSGFDYYLWLNDDIMLHEDALAVLINLHLNLLQKGRAHSIIIASTKDPNTGEFTYGGYLQRGRFNPLKLKLVPPADVPISCDAFCGNCVLIPKQVAEVVGNIDPAYQHRWGDVDYGLRAKASGCEIWVAPGYLADCESNPMADQWKNPRLPLKKRLQELHSIKGLGKADWWRFVRKHGGAFWLLNGIRPYLRILYDTIV